MRKFKKSKPCWFHRFDQVAYRPIAQILYECRKCGTQRLWDGLADSYETYPKGTFMVEDTK